MATVASSPAPVNSPTNAPTAARFAIFIVERTRPGKATITPADVETDDLDLAHTWVNAFNEREYVDPVGAWAVISPIRPIDFMG